MNHWLTRAPFVISLHFHNLYFSLFFKGGVKSEESLCQNMSQYSPLYISGDQQPMSIQLRNWLYILKRLISTLLCGWLKAMINNEMDIAQDLLSCTLLQPVLSGYLFFVFFSICINDNLTVTYRLSEKKNVRLCILSRIPPIPHAHSIETGFDN